MAETTNFIQRGTVAAIFETEQVSEKFSTLRFVIDTGGEYPQLIQFQLVNERCGQIEKAIEGQQIDVYFDLRGREWNGKYITNLNAWKIELVGSNVKQTKLPPPDATRTKPQPANDPFPTYKSAGGEDDLPF